MARTPSGCRLAARVGDNICFRDNNNSNNTQHLLATTTMSGARVRACVRGTCVRLVWRNHHTHAGSQSAASSS